MLLPPIGERRFTNDAIIQCFEIMNSVNKDQTASRIDYVCESLLEGFVNYLEELPYFCDEVLPRLERMGLREKSG